jgi:hypothetical protein
MDRPRCCYLHVYKGLILCLNFKELEVLTRLNSKITLIHKFFFGTQLGLLNKPNSNEILSATFDFRSLSSWIFFSLLEFFLRYTITHTLFISDWYSPAENLLNWLYSTHRVNRFILSCWAYREGCGGGESNPVTKESSPAHPFLSYADG